MLDDYGFEAIYITENGAAFPDTIRHGGMVPDEDRRSYLERRLVEAAGAIGDGVPRRGYFAWTLMDNFEWSFGYSRRFGLVHVDHATQRRTPKPSPTGTGTSSPATPSEPDSSYLSTPPFPSLPEAGYLTARGKRGTQGGRCRAVGPCQERGHLLAGGAGIGGEGRR